MSARDRMRDTLDRLDRWLRENQPAFLAAMRPGATDAELDDLERAVGRTLPEDVRDFYRWRAGVEGSLLVRDRSPFWERPLTLDEIRNLYQSWQSRAETMWREPDFEPGWWHPAWVPIMGDEDYTCYCVDTEGIWTGQRGQIIWFSVGAASRSIVAGSLGDWLRILVVDLERGCGSDADGVRTEGLDRYPLGYSQSHYADEPAVVPGTVPPPTSRAVLPDPDLGDVGNRVRIVAGPFVGHEAEVRQVEPGTWRVTVVVILWGRPVDVELEVHEVTLVARSATPHATEEWNRCDDARLLLGYIGFRTSVRKTRLFAAACYRILLEPFPEAWSLLEAIEAAAEDEAAFPLLRAVLDDFWCEVEAPEGAPEGFHGAVQALAGLWGTERVQFESLGPLMIRSRFGDTNLVREVFPNPFAPPRFDPAWRTGTVAALARELHDRRDFAQLPVLADALQDAGCDNDQFLEHLRDPHATHVRGCWALDLCLGLE